jgi:AraC-like DNA-binding protein
MSKENNGNGKSNYTVKFSLSDSIFSNKIYTRIIQENSHELIKLDEITTNLLKSRKSLHDSFDKERTQYLKDEQKIKINKKKEKLSDDVNDQRDKSASYERLQKLLLEYNENDLYNLRNNLFYKLDYSFKLSTQEKENIIDDIIKGIYNISYEIKK